jgi:hypothetical protein
MQASGPGRPFEGAVALRSSDRQWAIRTLPRREMTIVRLADPRESRRVALEKPRVSPTGEKVK